MRDGKAPADLGSMRAAAAVVPRIEKVRRRRRRRRFVATVACKPLASHDA